MTGNTHIQDAYFKLWENDYHLIKPKYLPAYIQACHEVGRLPKQEIINYFDTIN